MGIVAHGTLRTRSGSLAPLPQAISDTGAMLFGVAACRSIWTTQINLETELC